MDTNGWAKRQEWWRMHINKEDWKISAHTDFKPSVEPPVPADFFDIQRHAIKFAAQLNPGIKVIQIINEPSAAALAACFLSSNRIIKIITFDLNKIMII